MPRLWKATLVVLVICLLASIAIGTVRLATTSDQILGDDIRGWQGQRSAR